MRQRQALDILKLGHNVFLTGTAGSGKTYLLNTYIDYVHGKGIKVGKTGATGVAATHLDGITINSWAGIGLKRQLTRKDIVDLLQRRYLRRRFQETQVLIIDEVSMLPGYCLDMVNELIKEARGNDQPFGGMQVILCGDFFQLPPVTTGDQQTDFVYKSQSWEELALRVCYLEKEFRQNDERFVQILHEIRDNSVTRDSIKTLASCIGKPLEHVTQPTKLYTRNVDVDAINERELANIDREEHVFTMEWTGSDYLADLMKRNCLAPSRLVLKKGAFVMFVKNNFEKGYVNGTLGTVIEFDKKGLPIVETLAGDHISVSRADWTIDEEGEVKAQIKQLPLRLAWAITVHKSQGMSLDAAEIDLRNPFLPGMGYVALSRVRSLDGVRLMGLNKKALEVNEEILELDSKLRAQSAQTVRELQDMEWSHKENLQKDFVYSLRHFGRILPRFERLAPAYSRSY